MSPGLTLSLCAGSSESWLPSSPRLLRKPLPHGRVRSPSRPSRPSQAPQTPGLWLQPSSLSSLVSAFCVPLCTPGPKDPDLGWETDPPGERLATAQLSGVPARYGGAPVGFCPLWAKRPPEACGATLPRVLPACLSQGASAPKWAWDAARAIRANQAAGQCRPLLLHHPGPGGSTPASTL